MLCSLPEFLSWYIVSFAMDMKTNGWLPHRGAPLLRMVTKIQMGETNLLAGTHLKQNAGSLEPTRTAGRGRNTEVPCPARSGLRKVAESEFPLAVSEAWPMKVTKKAAEWGESVDWRPPAPTRSPSVEQLRRSGDWKCKELPWQSGQLWTWLATLLSHLPLCGSQ